MKKCLLPVVCLLACSLLGSASDLKDLILNNNKEMLKELKISLTEVYEKHKTKDTQDYNIVWNETDNWNVGNSFLEAWPVIPADAYTAFITAENPISMYLCSDSNCNSKIAKINLPSFDSVFGMYTPPMPWVVDSEDGLGFFDAYYVGPENTYTLTFEADKTAYYSNTGRIVNDKELFTINSGEYYIAIYVINDTQEFLLENHKFTVDNTVDLNDYKATEVKVSYYSGDIVIDNQLAQKADIKVFDITGRQVDFAKLDGKGRVSFDMSSKAKGVYIVNVKGNGFSISRKIAVM